MPGRNNRTLIISAGRSRSGSTVLYNLQRLSLISAFGEGRVYATHRRRYNKNDKRAYHLVKSHGGDNFLFNNANYIFSCERNIVEQAISIIKFGRIHGRDYGEHNVLKLIKRDLGRYNKWRAHKSFTTTYDYEDIKHNKEYIIKDFCNTLELEIDVSSVISRFEAIQLPKNSTPNDTCFRQHHITSSKLLDLKLSEDTIRRLKSI